MKPLIIIPTYNEKENIKKLIEEIKKKVSVSILIVDDSPDNETVNQISEFSDIFILKRNEKKGLASAYIEGIKFGIEKKFDIFIEMDADFSHNPKYLPQIIEKLKTHDLVIASRNVKGGCVKGWSTLRNIISKGGSKYSSFVLNCPIKDLTGGYNGWNIELIKKIGLDKIISKGYCFQIEMKYRAYLNNAKFCEIPIIFEDRKFGKSKMNKNIIFEAFFNVLKLKHKVKEDYKC